MGDEVRVQAALIPFRWMYTKSLVRLPFSKDVVLFVGIASTLQKMRNNRRSILIRLGESTW